MRSDKLYLTDIVDAGNAVKSFLTGISTFSDFVANDMANSAILYKLVVIGEAASNISPELKAKYP